MVARSQILDARRRLANAESIRQVARATGLGRGTVCRIANGRHVSSGQTIEPEHRRCGGCGGKVKAVKIDNQSHSCLACAVREAA